MDYLFEDIETVLDLHGQQGCKFFMGIDVGVAQMIEDRTSMVSFATTATPLLPSDDTLLEAYDHMQRLVHKVDDFMRDGSGWIEELCLIVCLFLPAQPLKGLRAWSWLLPGKTCHAKWVSSAF